MSGNFVIPFLLSLVPMICWGIMDVISGSLGRQTKAIIVLFGVQFAGLVLLLPLFPFFGGQPSNWLWLIILGLLPLGGWLLYLKAAKIGAISVAGPISRANFVFASILGILFLGETVTVWKIVSIIVVFAGGILLSIKRDDAISSKSIIATGTMFAVLSALSTGLLLFLLATFSRTSGWYATTFFLRVGVAGFAFLGLLPNRNLKEVVSIKTPWLLISIAALADVIGLSIYNLAVTHYAVSYVSVIASSASLVTVIFARVWIKERLSLMQYGGIALMLLGIITLQIQ